MTKHNPSNERIKRQYFMFLKEAKRHSESTVDAAAEALARFETATKHRDFKAFHFEQAVAFKNRLAEQRSQQSGKPLSQGDSARHTHALETVLSVAGRATRLQVPPQVFRCRILQPVRQGHARGDGEARNGLPDPGASEARPIGTMPHDSEIQRRNRALVAFTLLTGARDSAIASMKLKHIDLAAGSVCQDAREVNTKFSKTFTTYFFPVGEDIRRIVEDWATYLRQEKLWGNDDPLFPATNVVVGPAHQFQAAGLKPEHWSTAAPIRTIFREAFTAGGLRYFNPHSLRSTLVALGEAQCQTPEQFKAWSQNLGHEGVLTTFTSYGAVGNNRQREIIGSLGKRPHSQRPTAQEIAKAVALLSGSG